MPASVAAVAAALGVETSAVFVIDAAGLHDAMHMQVPRTFEAVVIEPDVAADIDPAERRLLMYTVVAHLPPGGWLLTPCARTAEAITADAEATGLQRNDPTAGHHAWRRGTRRTIHDLVAEARERIRRWTPNELRAARAGAGAPVDLVVLDIRSETDRERSGIIPGSFHTPRTVLEWRVDPASGYSLPEIRSFEQPLVVVCNGGFSSSLAAAALADLGFVRAGDLVGGVDAWGHAGLDLVPPIHHFRE